MAAYNERRKERFCRLSAGIINFLEPEPIDTGLLWGNINSLSSKIASRKSVDKKSIMAVGKLQKSLGREDWFNKGGKTPSEGGKIHKILSIAQRNAVADFLVYTATCKYSQMNQSEIDRIIDFWKPAG